MDNVAIRSSTYLNAAVIAPGIVIKKARDLYGLQQDLGFVQQSPLIPFERPFSHDWDCGPPAPIQLVCHVRTIVLEEACKYLCIWLHIVRYREFYVATRMTYYGNGSRRWCFVPQAFLGD